MEIARYALFSKTVEQGSLSAAAESLGYSQSAASHMLAALEQELGLRLLDRSRSGVRLTDAGERLLPLTREILAAQERLEQTVSQISGLNAGTVRIGTFTSVAVHWLPELIKGFQALYPKIEFKLFNGDYFDVENWLREDRIDLGFVHLPAPEGFGAAPLAADRLLAVLPPEHPLKEERYPLKNIQRESFISLRESSAQDAMDAIRSVGAKVHPKYVTTDDYAIISMVEHGLGMSILPELLLQGHRERVRTVELDPPFSRTIALAWKPSAGPAAEKLREYILAWAAKELK